jgi:hypothetical protein
VLLTSFLCVKTLLSLCEDRVALDPRRSIHIDPVGGSSLALATMNETRVTNRRSSKSRGICHSIILIKTTARKRLCRGVPSFPSKGDGLHSTIMDIMHSMKLSNHII